jgi:hypothetical protein
MKLTLLLAPTVAVLSSFVLAMPIGQDLHARDIIYFDPTLHAREYSDIALDARDYLEAGDLTERDLDDELFFSAREPRIGPCRSQCRRIIRGGLGPNVIKAHSNCIAECKR